MSKTTNIILVFSVCENELERVTDIEKFKYGNSSQFKIVSIEDKSLPDGWYGGNKKIEAKIFLGAYNNFDLLNFIEYLKGIKWEEPQCVQLFSKDEGDEIFTLYSIR